MARLVEAAMMRFMPDQAAAQQAAQAEWRTFTISHPGQNGGYADLTAGLSIVDGVLDLPACTEQRGTSVRRSDALDLEAAVAHGAAVLKRMGDTSSENVRRARAVGDLARSRHHRLKTFAGWRYRVHDHPGTYLWSSPYNTVYLRDHTGTAEIHPEPDPPEPDPPDPD